MEYAYAALHCSLFSSWAWLGWSWWDFLDGFLLTATDDPLGRLPRTCYSHRLHKDFTQWTQVMLCPWGFCRSRSVSSAHSAHSWAPHLVNLRGWIPSKNAFPFKVSNLGYFYFQVTGISKLDPKHIIIAIRSSLQLLTLGLSQQAWILVKRYFHWAVSVYNHNGVIFYTSIMSADTFLIPKRDNDFNINPKCSHFMFGCHNLWGHSYLSLWC